MDLQSLKTQMIKEELGITSEFGNIIAFVDFGNVNNWFRDDRHLSDGSRLLKGEYLEIDLAMLRDFLRLFCSDIRFYYGHEPSSIGSMGFLRKTRTVYGKSRTFTKPIQWVRHHIKDDEVDGVTGNLFTDNDGMYIKLPKCNFDVEIAVDTAKLLDKYDTICLLSGDADFAYMNQYLRSRGKKIILIKGGHILHSLKNSADLRVNAQVIKKHITRTMQKPGG